MAYINTHAGDGHFVSLQALPLITNRITGLSTMGIDDVTPLAMFVTEQVVFSVPANSPIKNGQDLVQMLKKDPSSVTLGVSSSPGGQSHDAAAMVVKAVGQDPKKLKVVFFGSGARQNMDDASSPACCRSQTTLKKVSMSIDMPHGRKERYRFLASSLPGAQ